MSTRNHRWRTAAALTATALSAVSVVAIAGTSAANAAPVRNATTATDTTYLVDTLGLPADSVVEALTYDRFQWQLQQPGQFAYVIGDPGDAGFKAEVVEVNLKAKAAGVSKVYWFNPNLSGSAATNGSQSAALNLDTRNPAAITNLSAASQTAYGNSWKSLLGKYLGNGIKSVITLSGEGGDVAITTDDTVVNDVTSPLWDYRSVPVATPVGASQDAFFIYDKDHADGGSPDKIVSGINLTTAAAANTVATDVASAFSAIGGATIDQLSQFQFLKADFNKKYLDQNSSQAGVQLLDDADNAEPFAVKQITYPELVHLLNIKDSTKDFVILFGGTWCPNTQAVIKDVNKYAQQNNVTVYNFDTVLDGGTVNSGTTSSSDPFQTRNSANFGTTINANPTYLYANIVSTYLKTLVTQYEPNNGSYVTYFTNGDSTQPAKVARKLQVPFLLDYQRGTNAGVAGTAIHRQWIQQNNDLNTGLPTFREYMIGFSTAHPELGVGTVARLGLTNAQFPTALPIPGFSTFDWKSPTYPDTSTNVDDDAYLDPADATVSQRPASLDAALAALPASLHLVTVADATAALTAANGAVPVDSTLVANLTTIKADWTLAQTRKSNVLAKLGSYQFAQEAVGKLATFFGGLPGGVVSTQTVTAPAVSYGAAPVVNVALANDYGRVPTGTVTLNVGGSDYTHAVAANAVSFTLPKLVAGSYNYTVSYPGDDQILPFTKTGTIAVGKTPVSSLGGSAAAVPAVVSAATTAGQYVVKVGTPADAVAASGSVSVELKQGSTTKTLAGSVSNGSASISVPALAAGNWSVAIGYSGDANYQAASASDSFVVAKAKVTGVSGAFAAKPTTKKAGKYKVTVAAPAGLDQATGKVTIKVKKGSSSKTFTGSLSKGAVTVSVPKLAKGSWSIAISWPGDVNYIAGSGKGSLVVKK